MQILLLFFLLVLLSLLASSCNEIWASNFGFQHWYLGLEGKRQQQQLQDQSNRKQGFRNPPSAFVLTGEKIRFPYYIDPCFFSLV